jgi:hypothetical protein
MTDEGWKALGQNVEALVWDREIDALAYMVDMPLTKNKKRGVLGAVISPLITKGDLQ